MNQTSLSGILPIDKPKGKTSFYLVSLLRKLTGVKKIGHTGTLDPLATGVMLLLIGKKYTKQSDQLMATTKEYEVEITLGFQSDSYDSDGNIEPVEVTHPPSLEEVKKGIETFQGEISQLPPLYSAKKQQGKKLYQLAREGKEVKRNPMIVDVTTTLIDYTYPLLTLHITCSKGTYIRTIANDLGNLLSVGGMVTKLTRTRNGPYILTDCVSVDSILENKQEIADHLIQ